MRINKLKISINLVMCRGVENFCMPAFISKTGVFVIGSLWPMLSEQVHSEHDAFSIIQLKQRSLLILRSLQSQQYHKWMAYSSYLVNYCVISFKCNWFHYFCAVTRFIWGQIIAFLINREKICLLKFLNRFNVH